MTRKRSTSSLADSVSDKFGDGIETGADSQDQYRKLQWIDTGSYTLNAAINYQGRGLPSANMVEFYGDSVTGKSVMGYHVLRNTQELDGLAVLVNVEGSYDCELGQSIGIDADKLVIISPTVVHKVSGEEDKLSPLTCTEVFQRTEWIIQEVRRQYGEDKLLSIVWDTLAATAADEDIKGDSPQATMGAIQKRNKAWITRRIRPIVNATNTLWLILNQVYSVVSAVPTAEPLISSGGKAVAFSSQIRVQWIAKKGKAGKIYGNESDFPVGARLHFKVEKNRVGPPWREGTVSWYFDKDGKPSIDYYSGYLDYLVATKVVTPGKGKVVVGEDTYRARKNDSFYETEFMEKMLKEHPELLVVK